MRKVLSLSLGALAVLLLTVALLGCGGGKSAPTGTNLKSTPAGSSQNIGDVLAELEALEPPEGVDPVLFDRLKEEFGRQLESGGGKFVCTPSDYAINDFMEVDPVTDPPTVTWSSDNLIADGSLNGSVGIEDVTPIAMYYGLQWNDPDGDDYEPLAKLADYDRNNVVEIADITPLAITYGQDTAGFTIEWAEDVNGNGEPDEGDDAYAAGGDVAYDGDERLPDPNENGFHVWEWQFAGGQLPDVEGVWVRITPYDGDSAAGMASDPPIWIELGGAPPIELTVTDMLLQVVNTTNTEAGGDYEGTDFYVAPPAGGDTFGEAPANQTIVMVLSDIAFQYEATPYPFGTRDDLPIGDLTVEIFDGIMTELHGYMDYTVESSEDPPDAEAWTEDAEQPTEGYAGTLGPNDPGSLLLTATMPDNVYTQGNASFTITIDLDLLEDVNAPEVSEFEPADVAQNMSDVVTVRLDWGEDEVGTEVPQTVALYDTSDWTVAYTFEPDDPLETPDYPDEPGKYTLQRLPAPPGQPTTNLYLRVSGSWFEMGKEYKWRVSEQETAPDFERRSSLKKPAETFSVTGPEYVDMYTWPEEEFYTLDNRQPYIYFFPEDPIIRRNPEGHPTEEDPPAFEYNDPDAYDDIIKADGNQFTIIYGQLDPPLPGSPIIAYSWGDTPPATLGAADGELPLTYEQPHLLAGAVGILHDDVPPTGGNIAFSRFSKEGTLLGTVVRWASTMQIQRNAPLIIDGDFGVDPWGDEGTAETPDFSDKTADESDRDVVIFQYYNAWLRHNDEPGLPEQQRGTHLVLVDTVSSAELPDILIEQRIVSGDTQGGLCWAAIDVGRNGNTDPEEPGPFGSLWWQNIVQLIPIGTYDVKLVNPGAGSATYPDTLTIVP